MSAPVPVLIPEPFANDAGPSFINTIPATTADPQRAAYNTGFPAQTFQPEDSGGKPPLGQDFNGILNAITQHLYALQGGQLQTYRADVSAALTGYAEGALLAMADGAGYWICTVEDNTTDPDAGGAGWQPVYAYGGAAITLTGGIYTADTIEASRPFLLLTGTLSGNQQLILPKAFRHWLVINACVLGAFTLTVKTDDQVGGVVVAAGGAAAPTAIYCDTVGIYPVFTPSALPTSVAANPDTIVLRDNTGAAFGLTAALGDSTLKLATTAFVNRGSSLAVNGFRRNPDGSIDQWGFNAGSGGNRTVTFPLGFPNAVYSVTTSPRRAAGDALGQVPTIIGSPSLTGFTLAPADSSSGTDWHAIGR
jgi:hypothetical protein